MRDIPILLNHDHQKVIGLWRRDGIGEFAPDQRITREMLLDIFGGAGLRILEQFTDAEGTFVRTFEILEFSLTTSQAGASHHG